MHKVDKVEISTSRSTKTTLFWAQSSATYTPILCDSTFFTQTSSLTILGGSALGYLFGQRGWMMFIGDNINIIWILPMVLTSKQKDQLNKDILEYLVKS